MAVQSIASFNDTPTVLNGLSNKSGKQPQASLGNFTNKSTQRAPSMVASLEYYAASKTTLAYQSKDGDSVSLSFESVEYQKSTLIANGINSAEDWKKLVDSLKQTYASVKDEIVKQFLKDNGLETQDSSQTQVTQDIPNLPEYWNAENTSQRIVDFATSFLSAFAGKGEDFLATIKDAIDKGFSMAKDITGDLPGAVGKLVNNTHDLVMKKLDDWAQTQGITSKSDAVTTLAA